MLERVERDFLMVFSENLLNSTLLMCSRQRRIFFNRGPRFGGA